MESKIELSEADFEWIRAEANRRIGVRILPVKRDLVRHRLLPLLRRAQLESFREYRSYLEKNETDAAREFVNALTTNVTSLYRELHHFEWMADREGSKWRSRGREVRVWSAGCSTGEEPASIASVLHGAKIPFQLEATDIDTHVLRKAAEGILPVPDHWPRVPWKKAFQRGTGPREGWMRLRPEVAAAVRYRALNLVQAWPWTQPFDAIFCRNVLIYFDEGAQTRLVQRFVEALVPGGLLFLGHSESRLGQIPSLSPAGSTLFRKKNRP